MGLRQRNQRGDDKMDIKLISSTGDIYLNDKLDIEFYNEEENDLEIIQQIITMLNIRQGELKYNIIKL